MSDLEIQTPSISSAISSSIASADPSVGPVAVDKKRPGLTKAAACVSLLLVVWLSFSLWKDSKKSFPSLAPGVYVGSISGLFSSSQESVPFLIHKFQDKSGVMLTVLREGWKPQQLPLELDSARGSSSYATLPLLIQGAEGQLVFWGDGLETGGSTFSGSVKLEPVGSLGSWVLHPSKEADQPTTADSQDVNLWLLLYRELSELNTVLNGYEQRVNEQKLEAKRLSDLISEGELLRTRANDKLGSIKDDLRRLSEDLRSKQEEVLKLEESMQVSEQVTGMGRLATLSRESLNREWRVIDSLMRGEILDDSRDLLVSLSVQKKVKALRDLIDEERSRVAELEIIR